MKISMSLLGVIGLVMLLSAATFAGDLNASCSSGVSMAWNKQFSAEDNLVELIWAGPDGKIDPPDANGRGRSLGAPSGDDIFIRNTTIGYGYLDGFAEGRFDKLFSHSLIHSGILVYLRAWDTVYVTDMNNSYGDSELYQIQTANEFESYDFPAFEIDTYLSGETHPVELSSFSVSSVAGRVIIAWTTQSESQNLGFHIYKSDSPTGQKVRADKEMIKGALNSETRHDYSWEEAADKDGKVWYFWLADVSTDGSMRFYGPKRVETIAAPQYYSLEQNYPNPFNPTTTITFSLKETGKVQLSIFNLRGQSVRELVNEEKSAGQYAVEWNGLDSNGFKAPSGLYFYTIRVNDFSETKKMALTK
jgi:hypothetical protein